MFPIRSRVVNLRGGVTPIVDLRRRFNLGSTERTGQTRIIVVELEQHTVGVVVDAVNEVLRLPTDSIEAPSSLVARADSSYIDGIAKIDDALLILLDLEKALSEEELKSFESLERAESDGASALSNGRGSGDDLLDAKAA